MNQSATQSANPATLRRLSDLLQRAGQRHRPAQQPCFSSGCAALDRLLPGNGFRQGSLIEWLGDGSGSGVSLLALTAARQLQRGGRMLAVVDSQNRFYPPAAQAWGIDLEKTIVIRPANERDELWSLDQALRCNHLAAVVAWPRRVDHYTFRRLQLAAEESGNVGLLVRPASVMREPTWSDVRLLISPRPSSDKKFSAAWQLNVRLLRCRGRFGEGQVRVEINELTGEIHETRHRHLATKLAHSTASEQTA